MTPPVAPRHGDWMQTFTRTQFWPLDPRPEEVNILDIAHGLSMQCRYAGHVRRFYSVAEHCVHIRDMVPKELRLWALLHDASEAYLVDVPRPVKPYLAGYKDIESVVMRTICQVFQLPPEQPALVSEYDERILQDECYQAMGGAVAPWRGDTRPLGVTLKFWCPKTAKEQFMRRFSADADIKFPVR